MRLQCLLLLLLGPILMGADVAGLEADARAAFREGDYLKAAQLFGDMLEALPAGDPTRARTQYNRGRALQEAGRTCAAAEALFGYLSNPASEAPEEERRRVKARSNLTRARAACTEEKRVAATARAATETRDVAPLASDASRAIIAQAALGTGMHLTGAAERARSTVQLGAGLRRGRILWDVNAELGVETPPGGEGLVLLRPGLRVDSRAPFYWRVSLPLLIEPLLAAGVHAGVGLTWPQDGQIAGLAEIGGIGWLADPVQLTLDARIGVQARF